MNETKKPLTTLFVDQPETPEGKYLVTRRDGTVPAWPSFVLGGADPLAPWALRFYALLGFATRFFPWTYVKSAFRHAGRMDAHRRKCGAGDPHMGRHRVDDPATVARMPKGLAG